MPPTLLFPRPRPHFPSSYFQPFPISLAQSRRERIDPARLPARLLKFIFRPATLSRSPRLSFPGLTSEQASPLVTHKLPFFLSVLVSTLNRDAVPLQQRQRTFNRHPLHSTPLLFPKVDHSTEMGVDEKTRVSGEVTREQDSPVLPTVNPEAQKSEPAKAAIHPAAYVV